MRDTRPLVTSFLVLFFPLVALAFEEVPASELELVEPLGFQRAPAVATDGGTNFFAVWSDDREGEPTVYGARIDTAQHQVTDRVGVSLLEGGGRPAVAYGGGRFLVVDSFLQYVLLDLDGRVLVRGRIEGEPTGKPGILYNGRDFLVFDGHDAVHAATMDVDGRLVAGPVTIVPAAGVETQAHDVARYFNRERLVLLYSRVAMPGSASWRGTRQRRGRPVRASPASSSTSGSRPSASTTTWSSGTRSCSRPSRRQSGDASSPRRTTAAMPWRGRKGSTSAP